MENTQHSPEAERSDSEHHPDSVSNDRDLGFAGGGQIPGKGKDLPHNVSEPDPTAKPSHVTPGSNDQSMGSEQGVLGGRGPGQSSKTIGDQDKTFGHRGVDDTPSDPMTSRTPDQVSKPQSPTSDEQQ